MNKLIISCAMLLAFFAASTTTNAATLPTIDSLVSNLTIGSTGEQVIILQDFLRAEGVFTLESTGYFGSITENALKMYQTNNGIAPTGIVDAATIAVMQTDGASAEVVAAAAIERNSEKVPFALSLLTTYLEGLDVKAKETATSVMQMQWVVSTLERIMK